MTKLTAEAVNEIIKECLYSPQGKVENGSIVGKPEDAIIVDGIMCKFAFHPGRVAAAKPRIDSLLRELPAEFNRDTGGGWTFLNGCVDRGGAQWGEHVNVEALVCLGIAAGSACWQMKDMAASLPGGVPYFEVHPMPPESPAMKER